MPRAGTSEEMRMEQAWALGVDLGGTKLEVARVGEDGRVHESLRVATNVAGGPEAIERDIAEMARALGKGSGTSPVGLGVGMAGQIDGQTGVVHFSPNLGWNEVPFLADLQRLLGIPVAVTNDVRAITWGEWIHGAGRGVAHIVCVYVGTGIGGGVVSDGRLLTGCTNTAGELGHITIDTNGPPCTCGNVGCLEAHAGGWAIARQARQMIMEDPKAGEMLLALAGGSIDNVSAETVAKSASTGDAFSCALLDRVGRALAAGCVGIVNAFNPCRLILGGGVVDGVPELVDKVRDGVRRFALPAAVKDLEVVKGELGTAAGLVGAASLALSSFGLK
jgi:glucokinase